jgi:hypothetical protein
MKGKIAFVLGAAVGYVLGTRAGRERYEQIKRGAQRLWNTEPVQRGVHVVRDAVDERAEEVKQTARRLGSQLLGKLSEQAAGKPRTTGATGGTGKGSQAGADAADAAPAAAMEAEESPADAAADEGADVAASPAEPSAGEAKAGAKGSGGSRGTGGAKSSSGSAKPAARKRPARKTAAEGEE